MGVLLIGSERFGEHVTPPGHPESPARADVMDAVRAWWLAASGAVAEPRPAETSDLERVHRVGYLQRIAATSGRAVALDPDTYTSPASHEVALLAAGAAIMAADHAIAAKGHALALVRPPGHHAEPDRAMGFCLYNNVAVAAAHALARGAARVAIVDIDVHHGNGTQAMFYDDPRVLYVSLHQFPFYPGTGRADEVGEAAGRGLTVNLPLEAGATDADYDLACRELVLPVLGEFKPDLLLISAGYDAHERDPLAGMRVTTGGYAGVIRRLADAAEDAGNGCLAVVVEGGYHLESLGACLKTTLEVLGGRTRSEPWSGEDEAERARRALDRVRAAQHSFWRAL